MLRITTLVVCLLDHSIVQLLLKTTIAKLPASYHYLHYNLLNAIWNL